MMFRCPACRERCITASHKLSNLRKPCPACHKRFTFSMTGVVLAQCVPFVVLLLYFSLAPGPTWWGMTVSFLVTGFAASTLFFLYATPLYVAGSRAARIDTAIILAIVGALSAWGTISALLQA